MRVGLDWNTRDSKTVRLTVNDMPGRPNGVIALIQRIDWLDERQLTPFIEYFKDPASYKLEIYPEQWIVLNDYISSTDASFDATKHVFFEARRIEQQISLLTTGYFWHERCMEAYHQRTRR